MLYSFLELLVRSRQFILRLLQRLLRFLAVGYIQENADATADLALLFSQRGSAAELMNSRSIASQDFQLLIQNVNSFAAGALHRQVLCRNGLAVVQHAKGNRAAGRTTRGHIMARIRSEHARKLRVAPDMFAFRIRCHRDADGSRIDQFAKLLIDDFQGKSPLSQCLFRLLTVGNIADCRDPSGNVAGGIFFRYIGGTHKAAAESLIGNLGFIFDGFPTENRLDMWANDFTDILAKDLGNRFTDNLFRYETQALRIHSVHESEALVAAAL